MRTLGGLVLAAGLAGCGGYYYRDARPVLTPAEVVAMKEAGVDDAVIVSKIETSRVPGPLKASDIVELKGKGLADDVLEALVEASAEPAPPAYYYRTYYGYPYYDYRPWYPYGYDAYWYGPRYSFGFGYGYPYHGRRYSYPYHRGYRTYRSQPAK